MKNVKSKFSIGKVDLFTFLRKFSGQIYKEICSLWQKSFVREVFIGSVEGGNLRFPTLNGH